MLRVLNFPSRSVVHELVTEEILNAFELIFNFLPNEDTPKINIDSVNAFADCSENIITPNDGLKGMALRDLTDYLGKMYAALLEPVYLIRFKPFGEFLLNEIITVANEWLDSEGEMLGAPGTWISRNQLFSECISIGAGMIKPDMNISPEDIAEGICNDLLSLETLGRDSDGGIFVFSQDKDAISSWNTEEEPVPEFEVVSI